MIELLTGEVMMGALADILIWCLVFVGIYILCRIQRIKKDIIGNALEDAGKMKKYNKILVNLINNSINRNDGYGNYEISDGIWNPVFPGKPECPEKCQSAKADKMNHLVRIAESWRRQCFLAGKKPAYGHDYDRGKSYKYFPCNIFFT